MAKRPTIKIGKGVSLIQRHADRGDDSWYLRVRRPDFNYGREYNKRMGLDRKRAEEVAKQLQGRLEAEAQVQSTRAGKATLRVHQVLDAYRAEYDKVMTRDRAREVKGYTRNHLEPELGDLAITQLTKPRLWAYAQKLNADGKSTALIRNSLSFLRAAINTLYNGDIERYANWMPPSTPNGRNPSRRISDVIEQAEGEWGVGKREPYREHEVPIILDIARDNFPVLGRMLHIAFSSGCRMAEIRGLRWDAIEWQLMGFRLELQITQHNEIKRTKSKKTKATGRWVALTDSAMELLRRLRAFARPSAVYVFENAQGTLVSYATLRKQMTKVNEIANRKHGIPLGRTFHSARHTFRTLAEQKGVPTAWAENQAGHVGVAAEGYIHIDPRYRPDLSGIDAVVTGNRDQLGPRDQKVN